MSDAAAPVRAYRLTLRLDADTREDLANALMQMARQIDCDQLSVGVSGGPSSGAVYELLHNPNKTHENYFREVNQYLADSRKQAEIVSHRPKYAVWPGFVNSKTDGQKHMVSCHELMSLYRVDPQDCVLAPPFTDDSYGARISRERIRCMRLIDLYPNPDGQYQLPA